MIKKYEGPWEDTSLLKELMNKGKVYVECPNCGEHIERWLTIVEGKCYKCHQAHGLDKRLVEGERAADLRKKQEEYKFVKEILLRSEGCVISIEEAGNAIWRDGLYTTPERITVHTGESAWDVFARSSNTWCFVCRICGYAHFLYPPRLPGDIMWVEGLYWVGSGSGAPSPGNYVVSFTCQKCGHNNTNMPHPAVMMNRLKRKSQGLFGRLLKK